MFDLTSVRCHPQLQRPLHCWMDLVSSRTLVPVSVPCAACGLTRTNATPIYRYNNYSKLPRLRNGARLIGTRSLRAQRQHKVVSLREAFFERASSWVYEYSEVSESVRENGSNCQR